MNSWRAAQKRVPARQLDLPEPAATPETALVQLSSALLLCLIDLKAEQKERDDRVLAQLSRPIGARHRSPDPSSAIV